MYGNGTITPSGVVTPTIIRRSPDSERLQRLMSDLRLGSNLGRLFLRVVPVLKSAGQYGLAADLLEQLRSVVVIESAVFVKIFRRDGSIEDHGLAGTKVVTTAGVNAIVDAFQNTVELENFKYHGIGTGTSAEAVGNTALVTELTTEYSPNSTRATGTTTEGATANVYRTVATNTPDAAPAAAIREHGIFDQASSAGGTLLDRTLFASPGYTLASGEGLQTQYDLTFTAGS